MTLGEFLEANPGDELGRAEAFGQLLEKEWAEAESVFLRTPDPGDRFGPYRILHELGRGGQGVVFGAEDTRLSRVVALKLLHVRTPEFAQAFARFRREAETASRVDHPGICTVYETGTIEGIPFIAMRRVEGEVLSSRFERARRGAAAAAPDREEIRAILALFEHAARALHAAHEAGLVHRDVKPGNIMVGLDGKPVILDFGIAREDAAGSTITLTGDALGTPAYVAPEQLGLARGGRVDRRADVWSLGVALFEGVCGQRPFEGATREALFRAILSDATPDARSLNPAVGRNLAVVLETAIEKDLNRRYQTAGAFADDLRAVIEDRPIRAKPLGAAGRVLRWCRRQPAAAALVLALPLLATFVTMRVKDLPHLEAARLERIEAENDLALAEAGNSDRYPEEMLPLFERVLAREGTSAGTAAQAAASMVLAHLKLHKPEEALRVLERHAALLGDRAAIQLLRADAERQLGGSAEAVETVACEPRDALDHYILGMRELADGEDGNSAAYPRALHHATYAVALAPRPRNSYVTLRIHAAAHARDREALLESRAAMKALWPDAWSAWSYCGFGLGELGLEDFLEEAVAACLASIRLKPDHAPNHRTLALLLSRQGRTENAIEAFEEALRLDQRDLGALTNLGRLRYMQGDRPRAIELFERAIQVKPDCAFALDGIGQALQADDRFEEALAFHQRAVRAKPKWASMHFNLGNAYLRLGRPLDAIAPYREAIRLDAKHAKAHNNLGSVLMDLGRHAEAIEPLQRAIVLKPDYFMAHLNLGRNFFDDDRIEEAIAALTNAARIAAERTVSPGPRPAIRGWLPDRIDVESVCAVHDELAQALQRAGRYRDALREVRRARELDRDCPERNAARDGIIASLEPRAALEVQLESHRAKETSPGPARVMELSSLALDRNLPRLALRWMRESIAAHPAFADNPKYGFRYTAARAAVRSSADGLGDAAEAASLREEALGWLESDLDSIATLLEQRRVSEEWAQNVSLAWSANPDFAPVRPDRLSGFADPEAVRWRALWERVEALRAR